ncbi:MAG: P27 family phage terminase small subunit [Xanthobacteraceae bacterium]
MRLGSINPCARGALVHNRVRFGSRRPLARRYALWAEATEAIQKFGTMVKSPSGFPIQSPYVSIANRQAEIMMRIASEFGFTPASRSRISTPSEREPTLFDIPCESTGGAIGQ